MGRDFPSIFFLLPAMVYILLGMGMCFPFPLRMQSLGNNSLLFGSFILNPRAFLNRENSLGNVIFSWNLNWEWSRILAVCSLQLYAEGLPWITADVLGASLFAWGFKQWKPTENRRFSEERKRKCLNIQSMGGTAQSVPRWGSRNRQSCCVCEGSWTEAAPQLLWNAVSSPEQLRATLAPSFVLPSACTAPWVPCSEHEGSPGWFALLMWAQHPQAGVWHWYCQNQPTAKAQMHWGVPGGAVEPQLWTPALNPSLNQNHLHGVLCACSGGRGMIKGDDDQGSYFSALSSSCCYINNANRSAVTGIPVFPQLWIYSNRFSQL